MKLVLVSFTLFYSTSYMCIYCQSFHSNVCAGFVKRVPMTFG